MVQDIKTHFIYSCDKTLAVTVLLSYMCSSVPLYCKYACFNSKSCEVLYAYCIVGHLLFIYKQTCLTASSAVQCRPPSSRLWICAKSMYVRSLQESSALMCVWWGSVSVWLQNLMTASCFLVAVEFLAVLPCRLILFVFWLVTVQWCVCMWITRGAILIGCRWETEHCDWLSLGGWAFSVELLSDVLQESSAF